MEKIQLEPIYSVVGRHIKDARKSRKITQTALAARVGLHDAGHMSAIELGKQRIQMHTLVAIARELGVSVCTLLEET